MSVPDSTTFSADVFDDDYHDLGVIARILPINDAAKAAFDGLARGQDRGLLHEYHSSFIQVEGFAKRQEVVYSSDSETDIYSPKSPQAPNESLSTTEFEQLDGHYVLSLLKPPLLASGVGWRIGKGSIRALEKSVDILVITPGRSRSVSDVEARMRSSLASVHAHIQLHRKSGVLMLSAGDSRKPLEVYDEDTGDWSRLVHPETIALHQPYNRFRLGLLEFAIVYPRIQHDREDADYKDLLKARNDYMKEHLGVRAPHPQIPVVPQRDRHIRDGLRIFRTVGAGGFGWVSAAIDVATGDPFAVKETVIKHRDQIAEVQAEFDIGQSIPEGSEGLVRSSKMFCEHENLGPCGQRPEVVWIVSDLARMDFGNFPFTKLPRRQRLNLLRQLCSGLATLHAAGIMHRDISERNCLILSADPAQAGICDFGKATRLETSTDPVLGPKYTLAPEVDGQRLYDRSIDIWSLGLVFFRILFPGQPVARLSEKSHTRVMQLLTQNVSSDEAKLFELISQMLSWDPKDRPTAAEALARMKKLEHGTPPKDQAMQISPVDEPASKKVKAENLPQKQPAMGELESTKPYTHEPVPRLYAAGG